MGVVAATAAVMAVLQTVASSLLRPESVDWSHELTAALAAAAVAVPLGALLASRAVAPVRPLGSLLSRLAEGDLTPLPGRPPDPGALAALTSAASALQQALRVTVLELGQVSSSLEGEAREILGGATRHAATAAQQAAAINQTGTTAAEIAQTAKQATLHADSVIEMTRRSEDLSREGLQVVEQAVGASAALGEQVKRIAATMTDLSERTLQVGEIITTVKDLAEQSNLLALNASIEASKAGEHGRGFAVVAMEMRNLASQSREAAVQIRSILGDIQKGSRDAAAATDEGSTRASSAVALARSAGEAIEEVATVVRESAVAARQIAAKTRQQTVGVEQMVSAIAEVSQAIHENAQGARTMETGAAALGRLADRLGRQVRRYRT